ncbi:protein FAR1-related sequence 11 [Tanacetum coccineum]
MHDKVSFDLNAIPIDLDPINIDLNEIIFQEGEQSMQDALDKPFVGQYFLSEEEAFAFYQNFAKKMDSQSNTEEHNHELLSTNEVRFLPSYRSITTEDEKRILFLKEGGLSIRQIMRVMELEKNVSHGQLPFLSKDVRNFLSKVHEKYSHNDAKDLLEYCMKSILCRHILSVFLHKDCFDIPVAYLLSRWSRKEVTLPQEVFENSTSKNNDEVQIEVINMVQRPPKSKTKGRPKQRMKGGIELAKNVYSCSLCNGVGHNISTCPKKEELVSKSDGISRRVAKKKKLCWKTKI